MSVITPSERALLDTIPQQTKLYLSVYRPAIALMCQATGDYSAVNQSIPYGSVTSGSYTNITDYLYQVALIGSTPGDDDLGRTWVRSATASTLRFVESDHINWNSSVYITVLKYTEIIPVFPRIIQNPANEEDVIFYKVWDIAYTNQNSILGSFINMGSHYAGFLDGGSTQVYWSASGTTNLIGDSLTYSWLFEGASITGSTSHTPGNVTYTSAGHYRTTLTVTSASGRVDQSVRYVSIYDRPGSGPNVPVLNWEMSEFGGSRDSVGYTGRIRVRGVFNEDAPIQPNSYIDGALVVIFKEDWYGDTKQSISKADKGREGIFFVGYINGGSIQFDYTDNSVEFEILSPTNLMEITECFSVSVESKTAPTVWYELKNMDIRRAVYHYLAWHSSVLLCCDLEARNFTDRNIQYFDADRTSLYDAINSVVNGARRGRVMSNSLGKIWIEQDVSVIHNAASTLNTALTLTRADMIDQPLIEERQMQNTSFIEWGGIAYNPATGQSTALLASAPGSAPAYRGKPDRSQGFALGDQDELNEMVGDMYAYANSRYPTASFKLRGNFANLDIAPQELVKVNLVRGDTPRGITFTNKPFAVRGVNHQWDARNEVLLTSIDVAEVTQGFVGTSIAIPIEPPDVDDNNGGSVNQPPITVPPITTTTPSTSGSAVNVYENGVFKMTTNNLNFIGSIVRVYANTAQSRADIYFDACGCSGTFVSDFSCISNDCRVWHPTGTSGGPAGTFWMPAPNTPGYTGSASDPCNLNITTGGNMLFRANATGMWQITLPPTEWQYFSTLALNFGYIHEWYIGNGSATDELVLTKSGNVTKASGGSTVDFATDTDSHSITRYMQEGEEIGIYCVVTITSDQDLPTSLPAGNLAESWADPFKGLQSWQISACNSIAGGSASSGVYFGPVG